MEKAKKSKLNKSLTNGKYESLVMKKYKHGRQLNSYKRVAEELKKKEPFVDFETEVLPYLSENHKYIFKNYMIAPNGELQSEIADNLLLTTGGISRAIRYIFTTIDSIIERKKQIENLAKKYGGHDALEDLALCLSENERNILYEVVLQIDPKAMPKYHEKHSDTSGSFIARNIEKSLDGILSRKKECEKFIKDNGGEDFLINEFGATLSEEHFEILLHFIMDYHYLTIHEACADWGGAQNYLLVTIKKILEKLEKYKGRKAEVKKMLDAAGGEERVYRELYSKLDDKKKIIFEQRFLSYSKVEMKDIAKEIGEDLKYVSNHCKYIDRKLKQLEETAANQKHS